MMTPFALLAAVLIPGAAPGVWDARARAAELDEMLEAMRNAPEYTVDFTVAGVKESARLRVEDRPDRLFFRRVAMGEWIVGTWSGSRVIPFILSSTCAGDPGGSLRATVRLPGRPAYTLRSRGLYEDLFVLRCLPVGERFAAWVKKSTPPDSRDVLVARDDMPGPKAFDDAKKRVEGAKDIEPTKELAPAVELASVEYGRRRVELMARIGRSYLFYPGPNAVKWRLSRDGDTLFASAGCHDRMFHASFVVELRRDGKAWKFVRLLGEERFKGD